MAVTYGFYNSLNGDRKYYAEQMSSIFNGIITDGVFSTIGNALTTVAGTGLQVIVKPGKAWFNGTWTLNDALLPLDIETADVSLGRIDAVILEVDSSVSVRANSIKVLKGTASANPVKPTLTSTENVHQYALAYITVAAGATSITAGNIEINVGKSSCPFVTSVLQQTNIDQLFAQWEAEFDAWFSNVQSQLSGDVATNLQRQIDEVKTATGITITDSTASIIGISNNASVDEALNTIGAIVNMLKTSKSYLTAVIKDNLGNPIPGIPISIVTDANGVVQSSNDDGIVKGYISEGSQTIDISGYVDVSEYNAVIDAVKGNFYTESIVLNRINFLKIIETKTLRFSELVSSVDVNCIGGGGAGGDGYAPNLAYGNTTSGGGGGGGHSVIMEGMIVNPGEEYQAIVGAGGASPGENGGTSSFLGVSASGGDGGDTPIKANLNALGGIGNGNGARGVSYGTDRVSSSVEYANGKTGTAGTEIGYASYTETVIAGGGGGSGASGDTGSGGAGGGNGGYGGSAGNNQIGGNGTDELGGGGGSGFAYYKTRDTNDRHAAYAPGKGGSGSIRIRIHFKT